MDRPPFNDQTNAGWIRQIAIWQIESIVLLVENKRTDFPLEK
jgi:hypothetical protein